MYSPQKRYEYRLKHAAPLLDAFWEWMDHLKGRYDAGSRLGKAVQYVMNRKPYLNTYLKDGRCSLSNNAAENAIRPFCVGRRNWLFSDTPTGAHSSAKVYTMVEMAKAHNLNVEAYLVYLLKARPHPKMTDEELEKLMPWSHDAITGCAKVFEE